MREVIWDSSFKRAFKRVIRKQPLLEPKVLAVLKLLIEDPFIPSLRAHKLKGDLEGLWACWIAYDCRIVFSFEKFEEEELIVLIDIGGHDDVY
jgi:mRNA interferase YafQ